MKAETSVVETSEVVGFVGLGLTSVVVRICGICGGLCATFLSLRYKSTSSSERYLNGFCVSYNVRSVLYDLSRALYYVTHSEVVVCDAML